MRTFALLTTIALALAAFPYVAGQDSADSASPDGDGHTPVTEMVDIDPQALEMEALLARIAALEALLAEALGGGSSGDEVGEPCTTTVGCLKLPLYVDEDGDEMTGELHMLNRGIKFFPGGSPTDAFDLGHTSFLNNTGFDIRAPTNFTSEVKLEPNARLNTTGGAEVFIDYFGNLTFADGSFMNPDRSVLNQAVTFTEQVFVQKNITVIEGGNIIFENNTGVLQNGNFTRIGTTTHNPFFIMTNDTNVMVFRPGPTANDAANVIAGHSKNNITSPQDFGNFIAGGGSELLPNVISGRYNIILGGVANQVEGNSSAVGGQGAHALHDNTFLWNDGGQDIASAAANTFIVNATGGVGIGTTTPTSALTVNGDITPGTNGTRALGAPTARWHQLYLASEIDFVNELLYTSGGSTIMTLNDDGSVVIPGSINAGSIVGDASGLTGITADALSSGAITTDKIADGVVTSPKIATSAVTTSKIADLAVTTDKISDGAVISSKLGFGCADGELLKRVAGSWTCAVDDNTGQVYSAGPGLVLSTNQFSVDYTAAQQRVSSVCGAGSSIASIAQDGTVTCEIDDDTTYGAGTGILLSGSNFVADDTYLQRRVSSSCSPGQSIRAIAADGTVTCQVASSDADLFDGLDSAQFLRSDVPDSFTGLALNIGINSTLEVDGMVDSDLVPKLNGFHDLGSSSAAWGDIFVDGAIDYNNGLSIDRQGVQVAVLPSSGELNLRQDLRADKDIYLGEGNFGDDDTIWFDGGSAYLSWQEAESRFRTNHPMYVPQIGAGTAQSTAWPVNAGSGSLAGAGSGSVKGVGINGPTNGYLGAQGVNDFDGVLTADWAGLELGVVGISTGGSSTDNVGVLGHSNDAGVRGEWSGNRSVVWAELGTSEGAGIRAQGAPYAADFIGGLRASGISHLDGDVYLGGTSASDDDFLYMDTGTSEYLQWDDSATAFRFSDELHVDGDLRIGGSSSVDDDFLYMDTGTSEYLQWDNSENRFHLSKGLALGGNLDLGGNNIDGSGGAATTLNIYSNYDVVSYADTDANTFNEWFRWYTNEPALEERMRLDQAGNLRIDGTLTQNGVDVAERFVASEPILAGQVVRLDPAHPGRVLLGASDSAGVLGVVSTNPGVVLDPIGIPSEQEIADVWGEDIYAKFLLRKPALRAEAIALEPALGNAIMEEAEEKLGAMVRTAFIDEITVPIALAGRVPVMVDATLGGPIAPGDALQASPVPGMAMKADGTGPILGTALDGLAAGVGEVLTFVTPAPAAQGDKVAELEQTVAEQAQQIDDLEARLNALALLVESMHG